MNLELPLLLLGRVSIEQWLELDKDLATYRERTRKKVQELLDALAGQSFAPLEPQQSFALNQTLASRIREVLRRVDIRLACPECHQPATLRASIAGNSKQGVFQFDHSAGGPRTTHRGSSEFPRDLQIVDAPPDARLKTSAVR